MIRILRETERGGIFRLGRFQRVTGPGLVLLVPLVDQLAVVDLDRTLPEWREVAAHELDAMIEFVITHYPQIPSSLSLEELREAMDHD
jgi:regulator of protease activity HflC (stomatin/prohibitin superfamily)